MRAMLMLTLALSFVPALAQEVDEMPSPPDGWWRDLADAEGNLPSATYDLSAGAEKLSLTMTIDAIDGSRLTYTTVTTYKGNAMPAQTQTVDLAENPSGADTLPEGAAITRGATETLEVGGRSLECTVYTITVDGSSTEMWHCAALPPVFSGAAAKLITEAQGQKSQMVLRSYSGKLIAE